MEERSHRKGSSSFRWAQRARDEDQSPVMVWWQVYVRVCSKICTPARTYNSIVGMPFSSSLVRFWREQANAFVFIVAQYVFFFLCMFKFVLSPVVV
jgi:hypothetical protein